MSDIKYCPCCHIPSSSGAESQARYRGLLKKMERRARAMRDSIALVELSEYYYRLGMASTYDPDYPGKLLRGFNTEDLAYSAKLIQVALMFNEDDEDAGS